MERFRGRAGRRDGGPTDERRGARRRWLNQLSRQPGRRDRLRRTQRSPGSTLKPFIYAFAIDRGLLRPTDVMADLPDGAAGIVNVDGHFLGPLLPRQALANSRNVPATNLLRKIGLDPMFHFLRDLGVHDLGLPADSFGLSMAIGSLPTTLERLVRVYGALANDGGSVSSSGTTGRSGASRLACSRLTLHGSSPRFSPIRWRVCRAFRVSAQPNTHSQWR